MRTTPTQLTNKERSMLRGIAFVFLSFITLATAATAQNAAPEKSVVKLGIVVALSKEKAAAYKSPKDLVGLTMGVTAPGSSSALALSLLMSKDNLAPDQISIIGVGAGNSAVAMMKSGRLDGEANFDPVITRLVLDGDLVPVVD